MSGMFHVKAVAAWGSPLPDWVDELAKLADTGGLRGASKAIGYGASTVSQVLGRTYAGRIDDVEGAVRGALMGQTVGCPVYGDIGRDQCLDIQRQPKAATNSARMRVWRACRAGCPNSRLNKVE